MMLTKNKDPEQDLQPHSPATATGTDEHRPEGSVKIDIADVGKVYGSGDRAVTALGQIDLQVGQGEFVCIVGPSGCGKTSLLRILAGLEDPSSGKVTVHQHDKSRPWNAMVFQQDSLFPSMTIKRNVGYGPRMRGVPQRKIDEQVSSLLGMIGLRRFADHYPHQLSGGMQQRATVARAFANDAEVLLMDEPFGKLDEQNKILLQQETTKIWSQTQASVVFITHSIDEAVLLADRVVVMSASPGSIKAIIPIDLPRPRDIYELRADPRFGELVNTVWGLIRDEVMIAARKEQGDCDD